VLDHDIQRGDQKARNSTQKMEQLLQGFASEAMLTHPRVMQPDEPCESFTHWW
jgi:hypothetical protein